MPTPTMATTRVPRRSERNDEPPRKRRCTFQNYEQFNITWNTSRNSTMGFMRKRVRIVDLENHLSKRRRGSEECSWTNSTNAGKKRRMLKEATDVIMTDCDDPLANAENIDQLRTKFKNRRRRPKAARRTFGQRQWGRNGVAMYRTPSDLLDPHVQASRHGDFGNYVGSVADDYSEESAEAYDEIDITKMQADNQQSCSADPRADVAYVDGTIHVKITEGDFERYIIIPASS